MKSFKLASSINKKLFSILAIFGTLLLLLRMVSGPSNAQFSEERVIDNLVPKHVPIKIKIKEDKERALKDMNNDRWTSDLELEVTNTSDKPIYLLELWVEMPEIISENGHRVGFTLRYGRAAFVDFDARPIPDDKPIEPKETFVFKIDEKYQQSWAAYKAKNHKADPKRIEITFTQLSFGDGSGFNGGDAKPYPYVREKASTGPCRNVPETIDNSSDLNLNSVSLDFKESRRTDQYGNQFRYKAKITDSKGAQLGRWAWDVFLVTAGTQNALDFLHPQSPYPGLLPVAPLGSRDLRRTVSSAAFLLQQPIDDYASCSTSGGQMARGAIGPPRNYQGRRRPTELSCNLPAHYSVGD